jgi:hypothetical protein
VRIPKALLVATLVLIASPPAAQQFLPPSAANNGWDGDSGEDFDPSHVVDRFNRVHAVWASTTDYTGDSGTDWDIFYAMFDRNAWTDPVRVNSYGHLDSPSMEWNPRIAIDPDGGLHVVWDSSFPFAGTGNDLDIFYSQNTGGDWSPAQKVNHFANTDTPTIATDDDYRPAIAVTYGPTVMVAWNSYYPTPGTVNIGADSDILYSIRSGGTWTPAQPINSNAATDTGDDLGVSLAASLGGTFIAVWHTYDDFNPPADSVGNDSDIAYSLLPPAGSWSAIEEVTAQARSDTGDDLWPDVAVTGLGGNTEFHVVWHSREALGGLGTDEDILHTVIHAVPGDPVTRPAWLVNSTGTTDGPLDSDTFPRLCIEPGGVIHCIWDSNANAVLTGTDPDIFHSANATHGDAWSPVDLVNLTGLSDTATESDFDASLAYAPNGLLTAMWVSRHDLNGVGGPDADIFGALGWSRLVSRPEPINNFATYDGPGPGVDFDINLVIAPAPDGTLHAVWASNYDLALAGTDFDIYHARLGPESWSYPELVNGNGTTDTGDDLYPFVAIGSDGRVHVVWSSTENIGGTLGTDADLLYAFSPTPGTWSVPEVVNSGATGDTLGDVAAKLVLDQLDRPHVIWMSDYGAGPGPAGVCANISYSWRGGSGWSTAEYVNTPFATPPSSYNSATDFAMHNGIPYLVWKSDADYNGAGTDDDILFSQRIGGAWTTPQFINDAASDGAEDGGPTLAFDSEGGLHVVWHSNLNVDGAGTDDDLLYSYLQGSSWTPARLLLASGRTDTGGDWNPEMAFDRDGTLHLIWSSENPLLFGVAGTDPDIFYTTIKWPTDFPTTRTVILANPSGYADVGTDSVSNLVIDERGYVHFAWVSDDSIGDTCDTDLDCFHSQTNIPIKFRSARAINWERYR